MSYVVVIEKGDSPRSFGAYVPDLPGCVAVGTSRAIVSRRIRSAIVMHLEGLLEDGVRPPKPSASTFIVTEVPAAAKSAFDAPATGRGKRLLADAALRGGLSASFTGDPYAKQTGRRYAKKTDTNRAKKTALRGGKARRK